MKTFLTMALVIVLLGSVPVSAPAQTRPMTAFERYAEDAAHLKPGVNGAWRSAKFRITCASNMALEHTLAVEVYLVDADSRQRSCSGTSVKIRNKMAYPILFENYGSGSQGWLRAYQAKYDDSIVEYRTRAQMKQPTAPVTFLFMWWEPKGSKVARSSPSPSPSAHDVVAASPRTLTSSPRNVAAIPRRALSWTSGPTRDARTGFNFYFTVRSEAAQIVVDVRAEPGPSSTETSLRGMPASCSVPTSRIDEIYSYGATLYIYSASGTSAFSCSGDNDLLLTSQRSGTAVIAVASNGNSLADLVSQIRALLPSVPFASH